MVLPAPDLALWRDPNYSVFYDAYIHSPDTVFSAQVNVPLGVTYPADAIHYDTVTFGAYSDIEAETLLLLGTTPGADDLGRQRVHSNSFGVIATNALISIGRSSQGTRDGELDIQDNAYLTILNLRPVWAAPPVIDTLLDPDNPTTYKDGVWPFDATYYYMPVANAGVDRLKVVETALDSAVFDFDGSSSFYTHPDATAISGYAWVFPGGTPATASTAAVSGVSFPVGKRYIQLTVTDDLGNTQSSWRLVAVADKASAHLISKFNVNRWRQAIDGQDFQIKVDSPIPYSTYPDGTEILIRQRERYNGATVGSLTGYPDAEDMAFTGWLQSEQNTGDGGARGFIGRTTLTLLDGAGRLKTLPGFPQTVERNSVPAAWTDMQAANIDRYIYYLLKWHSNVLARLDFTWSGTLDTYAFPMLGSDGGSLYDQADKRCQAITYRLTCNKNGQLAMKPDPQLQPTAAQAAAFDLPSARTTTVVVPISEADWMNYAYTYTRPPRVHWNRGETIAVSTENAADLTDIGTFFAVAPGLAPGQGVSGEVSGQQLAISQNELNVREGNRYAARMNAREGYFEVQIRPGDVIDPAAMLWVQFEITSNTAGPRGRTFLSERFLPIELNHTYTPRKGLRVTKLTMEREVSGIPAVLDPQPTTTDTTYPPVVIEPPATVPVPQPPFPPYNGALPTQGWVLSAAGPYAARASSFNRATLTINYVNRSAGLSGTPIWFYSNPWAYKQGFALTSDGMEYMSDQSNDSASWSALLTNLQLWGDSGLTGWVHHGSHLVNGWGMALSADHSVRAITSNNWASCTVYDNSAFGGLSDFWICGHDPNHLYACGLDGNLYRSTDGGVTLSVVSGLADYVGDPRRIHIPYMRNGGLANRDDGNLTLYLAANVNSGGDQRGALRVATGVNSAPAGAAYGAPGFAVNTEDPWVSALAARTPMTAFTYDAAYSAYCCANGSGANRGLHVRATADFFSTRPDVFGSASYTPYKNNINGFSSNPLPLMVFGPGDGVSDGGVLLMTLDGVNWFGNAPSFFPGTVGLQPVAYGEFSLWPEQG